MKMICTGNSLMIIAHRRQHLSSHSALSVWCTLAAAIHDLRPSPGPLLAAALQLFCWLHSPCIGTWYAHRLWERKGKFNDN